MGFLAAFQQEALARSFECATAALTSWDAPTARWMFCPSLSLARGTGAWTPGNPGVGRSGLSARAGTAARGTTAGGGTFIGSFSGAVLTSARFQLTAPYPVRRLRRLPFPARVAELVDALVSGTSG
jgi:hypothetical protein